MSNPVSLCTFRVGALHLGVEVTRIQEVIRPQPMTRIPGASEVISGLMNLRGQVVAAVDLGRRLNLPVADTAGRMMNVIVRTSDGPVGLQVHEIGEVLVVDANQIEPPPEALQGASRELFSGTCKLEGRLLLILNLESVLSLAA